MWACVYWIVGFIDMVRRFSPAVRVFIFLVDVCMFVCVLECGIDNGFYINIQAMGRELEAHLRRIERVLASRENGEGAAKVEL